MYVMKVGFSVAAKNILVREEKEALKWNVVTTLVNFESDRNGTKNDIP